MANLLYKEYKKGCYIGWSSSSGDYEPGDYYYGYGSHLASYYADLKPNTTYTIKRYDTSTRFRIALSSQDLKMLSNTTGTQVTTPFSWGFRADSSDPITFTTGDNDIYLVVYYTNDSEYSTRVMLNEGDTIQEYEAPTKHNLGAVSWFPYPNGYPYNPQTKLLTQTKFKKPYASAIWRIDENNNGNPYTNLLRDIIYAKPTPPPPPPPPAPTVDPLEFYDEYNAEYLYALRQKHRRYKIRVELLGYYENVIGEITRDVSLGSSGQVTINNEQITRRSCSLNLINVEKKYLPSQDSAIWFNRKFKLWLGIEVGKKTYWWSYGVFYTQKATCDGDTVSIQGVDKGGALDGTIKTGMLDTSCIVEAGTTLTNVIKDTLMWNEFSSPYLNHRTGASAYPVDPITPIISTKFDGIRTQNEITINSNDYISTLFSSIADGYGADAYYNTNGHFCFQVMADENRIDGYRFMAHQWDFSDEDDMYSNASVDFNLDGYNVVTVYTNESDLENVSYTAANNNPASPLRLDSAGIRRMADVEIPYVNVPQSEMQARCKAYADYLLMKEAMQGMSITFSCPTIPHLDVNRTIGITDKRFNLDHATFVVNSITMPLSAEAMTVNATQTSWLPDNTGIEGGGI